VAGAIAATLLTALQERAYRAIAGPLSTPVGRGAVATLPGRDYLQRSLPRLLDALAGGDTSWLAPGDTPDMILRDAWRAALATLHDEHGEEIALWRYGADHTLTLRGALSGLGPLGRLFDRGPFPQGGDRNTVCMGSRVFSPAGVEFYNGPSYRQICDPTDWDASRSVYPGGQSGHPASPHYADLLVRWLNDAYHPMLWSRPAIAEATAATLTLMP
jgi:penicillin amidase